MQPKFWRDRWESGQIGFHQAEPNPLLDHYWPALAIPQGARVFVPLCGKSLDMHWLREQGHEVLGVELSPIATREFFEEAGLEYEVEKHGGFERFAGGGYELLSGDFFDLSAEDFRRVEAGYDRASLIALPPELRRRYAEKMAELLQPGTRTLLLTLEYDQSKMNGPPHSVPPDEVESLFGRDFDLDRLETRGPEKPTPKFQERGLDVWTEHVFVLTRRGSTSAGAGPAR